MVAEIPSEAPSTKDPSSEASVDVPAILSDARLVFIWNPLVQHQKERAQMCAPSYPFQFSLLESPSIAVVKASLFEKSDEVIFGEENKILFG